MTGVERCYQMATRHFVAGLYRWFFPTPMFDDGTDWEAQRHFEFGVQQLELAEVERKLEEKVKNCGHPNKQLKYYLGNTRRYFYCPDCFHTFGGEETAEKKALIRAAGEGDPGELGED
jgi:hypothetical protein